MVLDTRIRSAQARWDWQNCFRPDSIHHSPAISVFAASHDTRAWEPPAFGFLKLYTMGPRSRIFDPRLTPLTEMMFDDVWDTAFPDWSDRSEEFGIASGRMSPLTFHFRVAVLQICEGHGVTMLQEVLTLFLKPL